MWDELNDHLSENHTTTNEGREGGEPNKGSLRGLCGWNEISYYVLAIIRDDLLLLREPRPYKVNIRHPSFSIKI